MTEIEKLPALEPPENINAVPPVVETADGKTSRPPFLTWLGMAALAGGLYYTWQNPQLPPPRPAASPSDLAAVAQQARGLEQQLKTGDQKLGGLDQDLRGLIDRIAKLEQRPVTAPSGAPVDLKPLETRIAALEKRVIPPPADLTPLENRLTALEKKPVPDIVNHTELSAIAGRVDAVAGREDQLSGRIQGLETTLNVRVEGVDRHFGTVDEKFSTVGKQIASVDQKVAGIDQKLVNGDQRLAGLEKAAGQVTAVADRAGRIARLQAAQAALDAGQKLGDIADAPPTLSKFAQVNPPTMASLRLSFPDYAAKAAEASEPETKPDDPILDRMWTKAQSLVTIRQGDTVVLGDPASGVLAHARRALDAGDLPGAVEVLSKLSGKPAAALSDWMSSAKALLDARAALTALAARA